MTLHRSFLLVLALALAGCLDQGHTSATDVGNLECVSCHLDTFKQQTAADPNHPNDTRCASCHDTKSWQAAHPESPFPIKSGKHTGIACATCHNPALGNDHKTNIDCYGGGACHADQHRNPSHVPDLCFTCHPSGSAGDGGG